MVNVRITTCLLEVVCIVYLMSFKGQDRGWYRSPPSHWLSSRRLHRPQISKQQALIIKGNPPTHVTIGDYGSAFNCPLKDPGITAEAEEFIP